jgi:hypothetical protein
MFINASISLSQGEKAPGTPDECANKILLALGGDPEKDICNVTLTGSGTAGNSSTLGGTTVMPPPPPLR